LGAGNFERRMDEEKDVGIVVEDGIWQLERGRMRNEKVEETKGEYVCTEKLGF